MTTQTKNKKGIHESTIDKITTVGFYTRVSSDEQVRRDNSLPNQKERLLALAKLEDWEVYKTYTDEGLSGKDDNRPAFHQLIADAQAGKFNIVAVLKIDRFMRDTRLLLDYVKILDDCNVGFVAHSEGVDTRKPGIGRVILALLGSIAQFERERLGERISDGRQRYKAKHQWNCGRPPFGYKFDKGDKVWSLTPHKDTEPKPLLIDESEAEVVRYLFREFTSRQIGGEQMAVLMNGTNHLPPKSGRKHLKNPFWTDQTVFHILHHGAYRGAPNAWFDYAAPAIVPVEMWDLAQRRIAGNRQVKTTKSNKSKYQGHLYCGKCGSLLRPAYSHDIRLVWSCKGRKQGAHPDGSPRCTLPNFDLKEVDAMIDNQIDEMKKNPNILIKYLEKTLAETKLSFEDTEAKVRPLADKLAKIEETRKVLDKMVQPDVHRITPEVYGEKIIKLNLEEKNLKERENLIDPTIDQDLEEKRHAIKLLEYHIKYLQDANPEQIKGFFHTMKETDRLMREDAKFSSSMEAVKPLLTATLGTDGEVSDQMWGVVFPEGEDKEEARVELHFGGKSKVTANR